jgi:predicted N-acyltransferase
MSAPLPVQLRIQTSISDIPRDAWDALLDEEGIPFLEWRWLAALEESGSVSESTGWHPRHLTLWRGSRLVAAAPAYLKDHSHGEFVFDWSWAGAAERVGLRYYPKLILAVPMTPASSRRVLVAAGEDRAERTRELLIGALEYARSTDLSSVHVLFPTAQECADLESAGFCIRLGVQYHWVNHGYASYEEYLARFNSKRRNQLRRERRAPEAQGIAIRTLRGDELASADPHRVFQLYCTTVDKNVWGHRNLRSPFFARILSSFRDRVELVEARREGRLVAGAFNLASPTTLYGRYWGCFEEHPFLHFNVCLYHSIEECIRRGTRRFEPGAGGEHKLVRGFEPRLTYSAHWIFQPGLDRAVRDFLAHERAAIEKGLPAWRSESGFKSP